MATQHIFTINDVYRKSLEGTWVFQGWNAAWFIGSGIPLRSTVDRIIFASDTATAVAKGPLSVARGNTGASSNSTDAWVGGGAPSGNLSSVERIIFSSDTATAVVRGPLSLAKYNAMASGNTTDAWFGGGATPGAISTVDRIIFSADTATAVAKGPLSLARGASPASGNSTDAWFGGGAAGPAKVSTVDRIIFASDTATAVAKGPLSLARAYSGASSNSTDAWFGGGTTYPSVPGAKSTVDRIIFASDTATAVAKGPLSSARYGLAASGNAATNAWFGGGYDSSLAGASYIVDKVIFASDTATAVAKGPLSATRYNLASN